MSKFYIYSKKVSKKFLHHHYPALKNHHLPPKRRFFSSFGGIIGWFLIEGSDGGGVFVYFFGIYIKFGDKNPSSLTPLDSIDVASHTTYTRINMGQKCEGNCGLWVLNEILKKTNPENLEIIVGAICELPAK